jgi:lipopolysaccharide export system protein LptA
VKKYLGNSFPPKYFPIIAIGVYLFLLPQASSAQISRDSTRKLLIETAELVEGFKKNNLDHRKLRGNVRLRQENTLIFCDSAIVNDVTNDAELIGNVIIQQNDTLKLFGDSATYVASNKTADLFGKVVLINGEQQLFTRKLHYNLSEKIANYNQGATLNNGKSQLSSKIGNYHLIENFVEFKENVRVTDPEFTMRSDTLTYQTKAKIVTFVAPTRISHRKGKIYTEGGFYDIENEFAEFNKNPQFEKEGQKGKADRMRYSGMPKIITLEGNASVTEEAKGLKSTADIIRINSETEATSLKGNAYLQDSTRNIKGEEIYFNSKSKDYQLFGRGRVSDPPYIIDADTLLFNNELGNGLATGSVIFQDTSEKFTIYTHRLDFNKITTYLYASGGFAGYDRPLLQSILEKDSLFLAADTILNYIPDTTSHSRRLLAYKNVRIYKSDLQAICDSLVFNAADSLFQLLQLDSTEQPTLWTDTTQFSADTLFIQLKNNSVSKIIQSQNARVINTTDEILFNQIQGNTIQTDIKNGKPLVMHIQGNTNLVYYVKNEQNDYVGVNESKATSAKIGFENNKINLIKLYQEIAGKYTPLDNSKQEPVKLAGFNWIFNKRPRSSSELPYSETK